MERREWVTEEGRYMSLHCLLTELTARHRAYKKTKNDKDVVDKSELEAEGVVGGVGVDVEGGENGELNVDDTNSNVNTNTAPELLGLSLPADVDGEV